MQGHPCWNELHASETVVGQLTGRHRLPNLTGYFLYLMTTQEGEREREIKRRGWVKRNCCEGGQGYTVKY